MAMGIMAELEIMGKRVTLMKGNWNTYKIRCTNYKKISGMKGYQEQTNKREKILETMRQKHMDQEQARNYLGQLQENELTAKENLYGK